MSLKVLPQRPPFCKNAALHIFNVLIDWMRAAATAHLTKGEQRKTLFGNVCCCNRTSAEWRETEGQLELSASRFSLYGCVHRSLSLIFLGCLTSCHRWLVQHTINLWSRNKVSYLL